MSPYPTTLYVGRHNLSPRGDGNFSWAKRIRRRVIDTTYPREGTETRAAWCWGRACRDTTYPREGTETITSVEETEYARDTTYPREGTETPGPKISCETRDDTTYPREGTETLSAHLLSSFLKTQLIPARGRKPVLFGALHHGLGHNLSPRGDGNKSSAYFPISSEGHNLSPRGDGNRPHRYMRQALFGHNLSPRGDGNSS